MNNSAQQIVKTTAAIVGGNLHTLGLRTSRILVDGGVLVNYFSNSTQSEDLIEHELASNPSFVVGNHHTLLQNNTGLAYVFYFIDQNHSSDVYKKTIELSAASNSKFTLITPTPNKHTHQFINHKEIESAVDYLLVQGGLNYRILYLSHLYGPGVDPNDPAQLSVFYSKLSSGKYIIPDEQTDAFPLYVGDVPDAILKATFSPSTNKKIFHLAGNKTNLVDFSYGIRSALQNQNLLSKTLSIEKISPPPTTSDVLTTQDELNWKPKTIFEQANAETINWFINHPEIKSQILATIKKPNLRILTQNKPSKPVEIINSEVLTTKKSTEIITNTNQEAYPNTSSHSAQGLVDPLDNWTFQSIKYQSSSQQNIEPKNFDSNWQIKTDNFKLVEESNQAQKKENWLESTLKNINKPTQKDLENQNPAGDSGGFGQNLTPKFFKTTQKLEKHNGRLLKNISIALVCLILITTPFLVLTSTFLYTVSILKNVKENLIQFDIKAATENATKAEKGIEAINYQLNLLNPILKIVIGNYATNNIIELVDIADQSTKIITGVTSTNQSSTSLVNHVLKGGGDLENLISNTQVSVNSTYHQISAVEAKLKSSNHLLEISTFGIGQTLKNTSLGLQKYKKYIDQGRQLTDILPTLLAKDSKKTYLILLQNNAELRPTGGFIGSYALVTFQNGTMLDIKVEDVYTADGQLKGHVEPPAPIKKYLGEAGWYLRDSNWDPNFPTSAARAAWFLEKELGIKVDGVVGINMYAIQKLLEVTGPINIIDFDETITSQNIFERAQFQIELNQFPGSTQKKDFIGKLTKSLIEKLMTSDELTWYQTMFKLTELASGNQFTIALNDKNAMKTIQDIGWSGEILKNNCLPTLKSKTCLPDYLAIIDANVSVNKVNYFIDKSIVYQPSIDEFGVITSNLTITISNTSPDATWPGGVYHNYSRIYTPLGTKLQTLSINGNLVDQDQITIDIESGKSVFGFINTTNPGEKTTINLTYTLPEKLPLGTPTAYQLLVQKQSGTESDPFTTNLSYPPSLQPVVTLPYLQSDLGLISHTTTLDKNQTLAVEFARTF